MDIQKIEDLQNRIIKLKKAELKQLEIDLDFDSKKLFIYDPDSSRRAWQYYLIAYNDVLNIPLEAKEWITNESFPPYSDKKSVQLWISSDSLKRIIGTFEYKKYPQKLSLTSSELVSETSIGIAGDCSFNFNEKKISDFWEIIKKLQLDEIVTDSLLNLLLLCKSMHHSIFNFSLMPTTGGLNCLKGRDKFDRLDVLIKNIDNFYKYDIQKKDLSKCIVLSGVNINQKDSMEALKHFLIKIGSTSNYCKTFYHIDTNNTNEKTLYDKLLSKSNLNINNYATLIDYIEFAIEFWEHQKDIYLKNLERIKNENICNV